MNLLAIFLLRRCGCGRKYPLTEDEATRRREAKATGAEAKAKAKHSGDKVAGRAK